MQSHRCITKLEALNLFGVMRLAPRISELRDDGHKIVSKKITVYNRNGEKCHISEYSLVKGAEYYQ